MGEVFELPAGRVEMELLDGVLHLTEHGALRDMEELQLYIDRVERWIERTGSRRALIDARAEIGDPPVEVREAMWTWLTRPGERGFVKVGFVLASEMAVARVNMLALARKADVRAFDSLFAAQRWLLSAKRRTTSRFRRPSSRPPPLESSPPSGTPRSDQIALDRASVEEVAERVARRTRSSSSLPPASPAATAGAYSMRPDREERIAGPKESGSRPARRSPEERPLERGERRRRDSDEGVA